MGVDKTRELTNNSGNYSSFQHSKQTTIAGAVAQLGERLNGIQEVVGSNPISSTSKIKRLAVLVSLFCLDCHVIVM